ncbi:membrane protein insertase YidC [Kineosporia sp. NBRC 101731]|uniref:membrane protein insertase YidC n=1 Tax=Kineosporia sp. NBRC 101731 TaxID=3032199 RepID=UPI0024A41032|nr:membrane protein insertase YidC [Kineosporia sp. NBRC 101731]GLY26869.1 membrane protein insertase YidC [Kineosporia sp. NBRC 101731]
MTQILRPLEYVVAWLMVGWHSVWTSIGLPESSGITWALSIVGLVVVIRIVLIPLFVKQIKASRGLQLIQPELRKIQAKYKGKTDPDSRQKMTQETMALYKDTGTNPFASCLPILLQAPIFFALFRVLNGDFAIGPLSMDLRVQLNNSTLFGSKLSDTFLGSSDISTKIVTVILIILMSIATFITQRQLMMKNMPASALDNPFAQQQKILLYVLPLVFAVSGVNFPIGVLLYWLTTNVWSMGQQFYVIRRMPAPGSPAEKALNERRAKRGKPLLGLGSAKEEPVEEEAVVDTVQRVQPKKQTKAQRSKQAGAVAKTDGTVTSGIAPAPEASSSGHAPVPGSPEADAQKQGRKKNRGQKAPKTQGRAQGNATET